MRGVGCVRHVCDRYLFGTKLALPRHSLFQVNHLDEAKGVSEEALESGNPMLLDAGVHGPWPASPIRSSYLDLHRHLLPRHVHTDRRSWAKEPAET
jgi:hypothetical protein